MRLPYGVKVNINSHIEEQNRMELFDVNLESETIGVGNDRWAFRAVPVEDEDGRIVKPYLRRMENMTEEEYKEYDKATDLDVKDSSETLKKNLDARKRVRVSRWYHGEEWLNAHHFDYRVDPVTGKSMIDMGLAEEAPDGMYEESEKWKVPKTVEEAVSTLGRILSDEDREYLLENGAVSMHDSLGRWIRNEWGLWTDSELKIELNEKGFEHPDDMSNYIIEEFIKYWNGKRID